MSCNTGTNLRCIKSGTTWDGLTDCNFSSDGAAFADSLTAVRMIFTDGDGVAQLTLTSANSTITIDDAANWDFTVNPILSFPLSAGIYSWEIETTDAGGRIKVYPKGTIEVF